MHFKLVKQIIAPSLLILIGQILLNGCHSRSIVTDFYPYEDHVITHDDLFYVDECQGFSQLNRERVRKFQEISTSVLQDKRFVALLKQIESSNIIKWSYRRARSLPVDKPKATSYCIKKLLEQNTFPTDNICRSSKFTTGDSPTFAVTTPFSGKTSLNEGKFDQRTNEEWAATLIHERLHDFGSKHVTQKRNRRSRCDISYVIGDAAQLYLKYSIDKKPVKPKITICSGLYKILAEENIIK